MVGKQKYRFAQKSSNRQKIIDPFLIFVAMLFAGIFVYFAVNKYSQPHPLPSEISSKINFIVFYPNSNSKVEVDQNSFKFDESTKLLTFTANLAQNRLTFAEQSTPERYVDIPQSFDKLIETLNPYTSFDSFYDRVYLTKPKELSGKQSAIMNSKGTLMSISATEGELTVEDWKRLFNSFEVLR